MSGFSCITAARRKKSKHAPQRRRGRKDKINTKPLGLPAAPAMPTEISGFHLSLQQEGKINSMNRRDAEDAKTGLIQNPSNFLQRRQYRLKYQVFTCLCSKKKKSKA
jgi:hypothetical protein